SPSSLGVELVLPLDRDIDPGLARVEIEMPRPEAKPRSRCDRRQAGQHAALEAEDLDGARILGLAARSIVAARHEDRRLIAWSGEHLMPIDAAIDLSRLAYEVADRAVALDRMHRDVARIVVGDEQIVAGAIHAGVDRARRQHLRLAMRREVAGGR